MDSTVLFAFGVTLFAGLATGIGSLMSLLSKDFNPKILAYILGFSAGVMLYVSFIEIFPKALESLTSVYGEKQGYIFTTIAFFAGVGLIALIDKLIPSAENPHEFNKLGIISEKDAKHKRLKRMGMFSALAIAIHNFPEGLATFFATLQDPQLGIGIGIAIAIHNIPEGIAISTPIYFATKNKKKAFSLSFLSGLSEPIGALIGYYLLFNYLNDSLFGYIFAGVAGIMVYISLDELLPMAEEYGEHHRTIWGLIIGMIVMALSLILFN
ncbi:MAG: zinc transporter ZupT [Bacteroidales bacterium]